MSENHTAPLYLSRLILNPRSRQVWSELAQPYEMHKTLMRAFPRASDDAKAKARDEFGVLFRADVDDRRSETEVKVYAQSLVKPDWSFLDDLDDYLLADAAPPNPACKCITEVCRGFREGQVLSFRLRANPTKRIAEAIKGDNELKGKRVGLLCEEEQLAWLLRKSQEREKGKPGGFAVLMKEVEDQGGQTRQIAQVNICPEGKKRGRKREGSSSHETTHLAVLFEGLLRITDADAFRHTLAGGIGPAKAYGFGLLSVAPVRGPA